ncbi:MAG: hypothetical protein ACI9FJ_000260 [Alteromonadaceae bacterium]|jgi:uncharacterized protein YacL (UPF0231 family)
MEYEFSRDPVRGGYHARFSMEHEVFSPWLVDEVGNDAGKLKALFDSIEQIQQRKVMELTIEGREYLLTLNPMDVTVQLNSICEEVGATNGAGLEEDMTVNNDHFYGACGLDDFDMMLRSWQRFLND